MVHSSPSPARAASIRLIRRIMTMCAAVSVAGAIFLIYEFGFAVRPHHIVLACLLASSYLVVSSAGWWLLNRSWHRRVRNE